MCDVIDIINTIFLMIFIGYMLLYGSLISIIGGQNFMKTIRERKTFLDREVITDMAVILVGVIIILITGFVFVYVGVIKHFRWM